MKVNISLVASIGMLMFIVGGITSDIGESRPEYVIEPLLPFAGLVLFSLFWWLGYLTRCEQEADRYMAAKGVTGEQHG